MESYRTEEEQVEALKRWWQENGRSMIVSVVVAVGLGLGWNYWQAGRQASLENASFTYQQMLQRLAQGTPGDIATAQELLGRGGEIDRIDLLLDETGDAAAALARDGGVVHRHPGPGGDRVAQVAPGIGERERDEAGRLTGAALLLGVDCPLDACHE